MADKKSSLDVLISSYDFTFACKNPFDGVGRRPAKIRFPLADVTVSLQSRYHAKKLTICEVEDLRLVNPLSFD